ncbi:MAG: transglycosylase SLT domain-containing protein [Syntrophorhabdaceae bacterium]|nr:transglycosylase SLT domain-containing protein [Syntrophorhabdaceae bacterium]
MGVYDSLMAGCAKKGYARVKGHSHYNDPIDNAPGRPAGRSRRWGDASAAVQEQVIEAVVRSSRQHDLSASDTARVLAIVRAESGFNPDAASNESAAGFGQFLDGTRGDYGIAKEDMFDISSNARAVVEYYVKCRKKAESEGLDDAGKDARTYKYYHDGLYSDNKDSGGTAAFSKPDGVGEWIHKIEDALNPNYVPGVEEQPGGVSRELAASASPLSGKLESEGEDDDLWFRPGMSM